MSGQPYKRLVEIWEITPMDIVPFRFEDLSLQEVCWLEGKPYFTRRAIGEWLEYKGRAQKAIDKIVERNPHIKQFSVAVNLTATDGKKYPTEVYDPVGLQLIIFESQQPKAIQFKVAVAHLVYAYMKGELKPSKWTLNHDLVAAARQIQSLGQGSERRALIEDLAKRDGVDPKTIYRRIEKATGERLKTTKGTVIKRKTAGSTKYPAEKEKVLAYAQANPGVHGAQIKQALGLHLDHNHINRWLREAAHQ